MITLIGDEYNKLIPKRPAESYKGTFGTLGAVVGSLCYQGAAYYAVSAALRTGVGIAVAFIPDAIYGAFSSKVNGAVIETLKSYHGVISDNSIVEKLKKRRVNAVLCGCGLGLCDESAETVKRVLSFDCPVVIDGDGLSVLENEKQCLVRSYPTVLTPHLGEFSRLCGLSVDEINKDRIGILTDFSVKCNCITVLKDSTTLISDEKANVYSLSRPCSALSKGGSGDVLAGMTASFIAQGMAPLNSAIAAVTLHNTCGRVCAEMYGERYCQPEDFIQAISALKV